MSITHHWSVFWTVKSVIWNNKNWVASVLLDIRTWPLIADVAASIVVKNEFILVPASSVASMYISSDEFCCVEFNSTIPWPGSFPPSVSVENV